MATNCLTTWHTPSPTLHSWYHLAGSILVCGALLPSSGKGWNLLCSGSLRTSRLSQGKSAGHSKQQPQEPPHLWLGSWGHWYTQVIQIPNEYFRIISSWSQEVALYEEHTNPGKYESRRGGKRPIYRAAKAHPVTAWEGLRVIDCRSWVNASIQISCSMAWLCLTNWNVVPGKD